MTLSQGSFDRRVGPWFIVQLIMSFIILMVYMPACNEGRIGQLVVVF